MRLYAKVYNAAGTLQGIAQEIKSATITKALDAAGSISLTFAAAATHTVDLLKKERRIELYLEQNDVVRMVGSGIIRDLTVDDSGTANFSASGPDSLDAFTRKSVLLGRIYDNQPILNIANGLVSLVPGWSISVDSTDSQTARFDGTNVLKALIRVAEEKGLHLREGIDPNTLEMGAFGDDSGIKAVAPHMLSHDLDTRTDVMLIEKISQKSSSRGVVNWIIPMGGGEGAAALTLKDSTRTAPYAIHSMTGPDGSTLYYLTDDDSITEYGEIQKVVTFKEISPVANSSAAKVLAANALYDAAAAWLQRNAVALDTYTMSVARPISTIRPGQKISVLYKGVIETETGSKAYLDVNTPFWVMKVTQNISDGGVGATLDVATVDRHEMDTTRIVVGAIEAINVRNISVQTFPCFYQDSSERVVQGWPGLPPGYPAAKNAIFSLQFPDLMTDVISVKFQLISRPLYMHTNEYWGTVAPTPLKYWYTIEGANYPCDMGIIINGTDRTTDLGGPWNPSGGNSPVDVTLDLSSYILNASGGIFQTHSIQIYCGHKNVEQRVNSSYQSQVQDWSNGIIEGKFLVLGAAQGIQPG